MVPVSYCLLIVTLDWFALAAYCMYAEPRLLKMAAVNLDNTTSSDAGNKHPQLGTVHVRALLPSSLWLPLSDPPCNLFWFCC
jgi:hypothetical protein